MRPILFWRPRLEQDDSDDSGGEVIGAVLKVCGGACSLRQCRGFHEYVDRRKMIFVVPLKP